MFHYHNFLCDKEKLKEELKKRLYPHIITHYLAVSNDKDTYLYIRFNTQYNYNRKRYPNIFNCGIIQPTV